MNNKILCVDDEESILKGFQLNLRKDFELHLASNGTEGLEVFDREQGFALVLSDMRMPQMDGATMLSEIKKRDPEVVTVLLTGHTDFESAMSAVNEGSIFRMLSKPCPPEMLIKVLGDGLAQHDLVKSKRILLDQTLRGAVDALAQSLSTAKPLFFGRAQRVRRIANELAEMTNLDDAWRVDIASIFSQLAYISLPESVSEDVYYKKDLTPAVKEMLGKFPEDTQKLIEKIPGLEEVGEILVKLAVQHRFEEDDGSGIRKAASILRVALDFDYYEEQGHDKSLIVQTLKSRKDDYDPDVTECLSQLLAVAEQKYRLEEILIRRLETGMRLAQELRLADGLLVASSGTDVDRQLLKVIRNYASCYAESPFPKKIQVTVPVL
ncbi:MAG: response regulator [Opitutae bacterium]|jgi:response regulator RpfG family c-di-GMP phosphodiesterase|nr:response regulator [Opitutae bacterium]